MCEIRNKLFAPIAVALFSTILLLGRAESQVTAPLLAVKDNTSSALSHATLIGHSDPNRVMNVVVSLKLRCEPELDALIEAQSNPRTPVYDQFIDPSEFRRRFGPLHSDVDAVAKHRTSSPFGCRS